MDPLIQISLIAGIPTIIRPFFGDQFFWADRVEALGVGTGVRKLTVSTLSEALLAATSDPRQISRAKSLGEQIRAVRPLNFYSEIVSFSTRRMESPLPSSLSIET